MYIRLFPKEFSHMERVFDAGKDKGNIKTDSSAKVADYCQLLLWLQEVYASTLKRKFSLVILFLIGVFRASTAPVNDVRYSLSLFFAAPSVDW